MHPKGCVKIPRRQMKYPDSKDRGFRCLNVLHLAMDLIKHITEVTTELCSIAEEGYNLADLTKIWAALPMEDSEGITYLEVASQCILEVSSLVDNTFPNLNKNQKVAKKYYLMAKLLTLKADQLIKVD